MPSIVFFWAGDFKTVCLVCLQQKFVNFISYHGNFWWFFQICDNNKLDVSASITKELFWVLKNKGSAIHILPETLGIGGHLYFFCLLKLWFNSLRSSWSRFRARLCFKRQFRNNFTSHLLLFFENYWSQKRGLKRVTYYLNSP